MGQEIFTLERFCRYQPELLASRLDPCIIDSGYRDLTLDLDTIPYCLVCEPNLQK